MGKGSKAPAAPDPYKTSSTEAQFNRLDTYGPGGGGTRYGYTDPKTGQFVAGVAPQGSQSAVTTVETPAQKAIREALTGAAPGFVDKLINQDITNLPGPATAKDTSDIAKTFYDRNTSLLMPTIERTNSRLLNNLQARGIPIGGDAFNESYGNQQAQTQDTLSRVAQDATLAAGQEQSRQFGLDSAARGNALSEIQGLMGGGYSPPTNTPSGAAAGVNFSGNANSAYQDQLNAYNTKQGQQASTASTLGSLAGSMLLKCTMEAKDISSGLDADFMAEAVMHMPLAVWSYKEGMAPDGMGREDHVGPMAEHFQQLTGLGDGKTINVIDAFGVLFGALQSALQRIEILERAAYGDEVH